MSIAFSSLFTRRKLAAVFCAAAALSTFGAASVAQAAEAVDLPPLRVGTDGTFPPFEFYDTKTGDFQGFELDLVQAIAAKMGRKVVYLKYGIDAVVPAVMTGLVDVGAGGLSITPQRAEKVLFTDPFYDSGLTILVKKQDAETIRDFKDLEGKRISVQIGSTSYLLAKTIKGAEVSTFNAATDAILNMMSGNADAVINDRPSTDYLLVKRPSLAKQAVHQPAVAQADPFGMIVAKGNEKLRDEMNAALAALKADGTYAKIHQKWFGAAPVSAND